MVRFQPCGRFEGVSGVFAAFLPPILAGDPRDFLSFDRPVRTGSDTSRQRRRESLVEPLCHFLRARGRLLCIAIPVYVAELFFMSAAVVMIPAAMLGFSEVSMS